MNNLTAPGIDHVVWTGATDGHENLLDIDFYYLWEGYEWDLPRR